MALRRRRAIGIPLFAALVVVGALSSVPVSTQAPGQRRVNVLINFANRPGLADRALVTAAGGRIRRAFDIVPAIAAELPEAVVAALAANARVRFIEADVEVEAADDELDDTWSVNMVGAGAAHQSVPPVVGAGVDVAIIDTGIDYTHPDLAANYRGGWDFYDNDSDPMDTCGHGTHVAGTVAAERNGAGVVGMAPGVNLYALRVMAPNGTKCSGPLSGIIAAIEWAAQHGMQITNNSYGSTTPSATADQAYANAAALGVLHVAAAMNNGNCAGSGDNVGYPARYRSVMAVANVDINDVRSCTSSTGPTVELAAPGTQVNSTTMGGTYGLKSGTSMASPHVAGAAALLMGQGMADANGNGRINDEVRNALVGSTLDLGAAGRDPLYGFGRLYVPAALAAAAAAPPLTVSVDGISYATSGIPQKNLTITVGTIYGLAAPTNATVSIRVYRNGSQYTTTTVTTDGNGVGSKLLTNVPKGTYTTTVTWVNAGVLTWDGVTPSNSFVK